MLQLTLFFLATLRVGGPHFAHFQNAFVELAEKERAVPFQFAVGVDRVFRLKLLLVGLGGLVGPGKRLAGAPLNGQEEAASLEAGARDLLRLVNLERAVLSVAFGLGI